MKVKLQDQKTYLIDIEGDYESLDVIRGCPDGRRYVKGRRHWVVPATIDNTVYLQENGIHSIHFENVVTRIGSPLQTTGISAKFKTKPYKHQQLGFDLCVSNPEVFLQWEMGTGKTWVALNSAKKKKELRIVKRVLIVCPHCVLSSWENENEIHTGLPITRVQGSKEKRQKILETAEIALINYELLVYMEKEFLSLSSKFDMVLIDESHFIKNTKAKRSKILWKICDTATHKILMTGTPVTNGADDLFSQFRALDGGATFGTYFVAFRSKYFIDIGWGDIPKWVPKPETLERIKEKVDLRSHRVRKVDCFDLPPKNYQRIDVQMGVEQKRIYRELEKELFTSFVLEGRIEEIEVKFLITKLMKLNQITSGFIYKTEWDKTRTLRIDNGKIEQLKSIIEASGNQKIVVWCLFREDMDLIMRTFQDLNPVREKDWKLFQEDESVRLLVGQEHAGGIGITLTASQLVVYYSQGYSYADRIQSEDRTHRIGTTGVVTYIDLICPDTVDEDIIKAIRIKRKTADYLTGDLAIDVIKAMRENK